MEEKDPRDPILGVGQALVNKISTQTDGGFRVVLDFPESDLELIQSLMSVKSSPEPTVLVVFSKEV